MLQHVADDDYVTLVNGSLLALSLLQGDFDGNGTLDATDLDALAVEVRKGTHCSLFDVTEDGSVNTEDHR